MVENCPIFIVYLIFYRFVSQDHINVLAIIPVNLLSNFESECKEILNGNELEIPV